MNMKLAFLEGLLLISLILSGCVAFGGYGYDHGYNDGYYSYPNRHHYYHDGYSPRHHHYGWDRHHR